MQPLLATPELPQNDTGDEQSSADETQAQRRDEEAHDPPSATSVPEAAPIVTAEREVDSHAISAAHDHQASPQPVDTELDQPPPPEKNAAEFTLADEATLNCEPKEPSKESAQLIYAQLGSDVAECDPLTSPSLLEKSTSEALHDSERKPLPDPEAEKKTVDEELCKSSHAATPVVASSATQSDRRAARLRALKRLSGKQSFAILVRRDESDIISLEFSAVTNSYKKIGSKFLADHNLKYALLEGLVRRMRVINKHTEEMKRRNQLRSVRTLAGQTVWWHECDVIDLV